MKHLLYPSRPDRGVGCGLFYMVFGFCFVVIGMALVLAFGVNSFKNFQVVLTVILFWAFGGMLVWSGQADVKKYSKFGKTVAEISLEDIQPGDCFTFTYRQEMRQHIDIKWMGIFLVFRERVILSTSSEPTIVRDIDRLVQQIIHQGQHFTRGAILNMEKEFCVPEYEMGIRNPYRDRVTDELSRMWVIKVRLNLGKNNDIWHEYEIADLKFMRSAAESAKSSSAVGNRLDVILLDANTQGLGLILGEVVNEVLPHLRRDQYKSILRVSSRTNPYFLMENVSVQEANLAAKRFREAGASIDVRPTQIGSNGK